MSMKRGRNQQVAAAATPGDTIAVPATAETNGGNRAGKPVGSQLNRPRAACQSGLSKSWEGRLSSVKGKCCAGADRPQKAMKIKFVTSSPSRLNYRVETFQLDPCVDGSELPIDGLAYRIAL